MFSDVYRQKQSQSLATVVKHEALGAGKCENVFSKNISTEEGYERE